MNVRFMLSPACICILLDHFDMTSTIVCNMVKSITYDLIYGTHIESSTTEDLEEVQLVQSVAIIIICYKILPSFIICCNTMQPLKYVVQLGQSLS